MPNVLITGANRGIGKALVTEALRRGSVVYAAMRNIGDADFPGDHGGRLHLLALDVTSDASVKAAAAALTTPLELIINNAGISGPQTPAASTTDFDGFLQTLDVNTVGPLRVANAFMPHLKQGKSPKLVTITSGMGELNTSSDWTPYRVSKVGVNKLMRALATDLKSAGIAVAMLCPGWVRTRMGGPSASISPEESAKGLFYSDRLTQPCKHRSLQKLRRPRDTFRKLTESRRHSPAPGGSSMMKEVGENALVVTGLRKSFARPAVDGLDLTVKRGELYALLGPNGAGKTTTLRMVVGLLEPEAGSIHVFGIDRLRDGTAAKRIIAWLPDEPMIYDKLSPLEYLAFVSGLWQVPGAVAKRQAEELLSVLDLEAQAHQRCEGFSRGMRQKVALAGALIHEPQLLILDEPLTGSTLRWHGR